MFLYKGKGAYLTHTHNIFGFKGQDMSCLCWNAEEWINALKPAHTEIPYQLVNSEEKLSLKLLKLVYMKYSTQQIVMFILYRL